jgi:ribA/ribD-fused uncharacterized protein
MSIGDRIVLHVTPTEPVEPIRFYRANEKPYGSLSNLFKRPLVLDGVTFPTAEHAYQYGKPRKEAVRTWLMAAPTPSLLAGAAHSLLYWDIAPGWSLNKVDRMRRVLRAKFSDTELRALLVSTGDARIIECGSVNNSVNRFWGEVDGHGKNMLGVLLMEIRQEILWSMEKAQKPGAST